MRDRIDRGGLRGGEPRVRRLIPRGLLLEVDLGEAGVGVELVLLGEQLFSLEELRERLERRRPAGSW